MKYTLDELLKSNLDTYYQVSMSVTRWAKVGELSWEGKPVGHKRCSSTGKSVGTFWFDNADEAFKYAEECRKKVLAHFSGKKIEATNRGTTLDVPFTEKELMKNPLGENDDHWNDYRYYEILPYLWGVSVSKSVFND